MDFSCFGNRGNDSCFMGDECVVVFFAGRVCLFFFLDDQGDIRAERAGA